MPEFESSSWIVFRSGTDAPSNDDHVSVILYVRGRKPSNGEAWVVPAGFSVTSATAGASPQP